jgi:hypothetical protein
LAKALAPEEIRKGQFVTPLDDIAELPSFFWCADAALLPHDQLVRIRFCSSRAGVPLKVKRLCLPFVLVKPPRGKRFALDVRKCRLARLGSEYAQQAWRAYKKSAPVKPRQM